MITDEEQANLDRNPASGGFSSAPIAGKLASEVTQRVRACDVRILQTTWNTRRTLMMTNERKHLARTLFQLQVHRSDGFAFEHLFGRVMEYSRPGFLKVKP